MDRDKLERTINRVLRLIMDRDYAGLEALSRGQRLPAEEIRTGLEEYPATFVIPPDHRLDDVINVLEIAQPGPKRYAVDLDLWSAEEGRSDLTVRLTLADRGEEYYEVEIDGIEVL